MLHRQAVALTVHLLAVIPADAADRKETAGNHVVSATEHGGVLIAKDVAIFEIAPKVEPFFLPFLNPLALLKPHFVFAKESLLPRVARPDYDFGGREQSTRFSLRNINIVRVSGLMVQKSYSEDGPDHIRGRASVVANYKGNFRERRVSCAGGGVHSESQIHRSDIQMRAFQLRESPLSDFGGLASYDPQRRVETYKKDGRERSNSSVVSFEENPTTKLASPDEVGGTFIKGLLAIIAIIGLNAVLKRL